MSEHTTENDAHYREPVGPDWLARQRSGVPRDTTENDAPLCCDAPCWLADCEGTSPSVIPPAVK